MSRSSAPSVVPSGGNPFNVNDPNIGVAIALLANLLQVVAVLIQASEQLRTFLFLVSLLVGGALVLWATNRWPHNRAPIWVFVVGTLVAIALFLWISASSLGWPARADPPSPTYYAHISTYLYDGQDGSLDVDRPLPEIPVVTRDKYKHYAVYKTRHNGAVALFQSYGPVLIGACGVYHTYTILKENDSTANAFLIQIGIDPSKVDSCK